MAEGMAPSYKGKEKAETSRAVWSENMKKIFLDLCIEEVLQGGRPGSNFKAQSWTKIVEGFKVKTGLVYGQKQLKNQWDLMRKQCNAWITLCGQTGVGYNEATQTITMKPERWDEYLKGHPDAKIFRTKPLSFPNEMTTLFGETQARGEDGWTPSSGSFPEDLSMQMASLLPNIGNTQNDVLQETCEDIEMEKLMSSVRRKQPGPSRNRKNAKISKFDESLERIVIILEGEKNEEERKEKERKEEEMKEKERKDEERKEEERKEKERKEEEMKEKDKERKVEEIKEGPTMHECITTLKLIPNIKET